MADEKPKSLHSALALFQAEHCRAKLDGSGNYGTYTTLASGILATQPAAHLGISHTQTFNYLHSDNGKSKTIVITTLRFSGSDEKIESQLLLPDLQVKNNVMQALGSAITYARRYALLAIYGLAPSDDDGEGSAEPVLEKAAQNQSRPPVKNAPPKKTLQQKTAPALKPVAQQQAPKEVNTADFVRPERLNKIKKRLSEMWTIDQDEVLLAFRLFGDQAGLSAQKVTIANVITEKHADIIEPLLGMNNDT